MRSISEGDIVTVNFNQAQCSLANGKELTVQSVPQATGDSWYFKDEDGNVYAVSEGCTITRRLCSKLYE